MWANLSSPEKQQFYTTYGECLKLPWVPDVYRKHDFVYSLASFLSLNDHNKVGAVCLHAVWYKMAVLYYWNC